MKSIRTKTIRVASLLFATTMLLVGGAFVNRAAADTLEEWGMSLASPNDANSQFTIVFAGDQTANISTAGAVNPFVGAGSMVSASFDGVNTNVTFSGPSITNTTVTFGLNVGANVLANEVSATWEDGSSVPVLDLSTTPDPTGTTFETIFFAFDPPATPVPSYYYEFPVDPAALPPIVLSNPSTSGPPLTFSNSGFLLSPTLIPLDHLNFGNEPPPGQPSSQFEGLASPPSLGPQVSEDFSTPEPASLIRLAGLLGIGAVGLAWLGGIAAESRNQRCRAVRKRAVYLRVSANCNLGGGI
jgi:hypothetical protein